MLVLALAACETPAGAPPGSDGGTPLPDGASPVPVVFPIEVFGDAGHVVSTPFTLLAGEAPATVYLRVHRPTWLETGSFADRGPKMAVRIGGSDWYEVRPQRVIDPSTWGTAAAGDFLYPVEPANVDCVEADAQFGGCLAGTYATVRFSIPLSRMRGVSLAPGASTIDFQFLGTDGVSMGYRVLDFDVRDASGASLVDRSAFREDDPDGWAPPHADEASIAEGRRLWESATLLTSPLDATPLRSHCNSCHALDGRDLAYFNFSNYAIVRRSTFHGLSEQEGEQIASFIRSVVLRLPAGIRRSQLGRPWNPPYQPGPGLDARSVALWAAGAGLDAVLDHDAEMGDALFPASGAAAIATSPAPGGAPLPLLTADGYLNPREAPQAIQLADWMSWLPRYAPEDITTDPGAIFASAWYQRFESLRAALEADRDGFLYTDRAAHVVSAPNVFELQQFSSGWPEGLSYLNHPEGDGLNWKFGNGGDWVTTTDESLRAAELHVAMTTYRNLRKWELFTTYGLEEVEGLVQTVAAGSPPYYVSPAGARVWPTPNRDMFEVGPHFGGPAYPERRFTFDDTAVGCYWTTVWYSLQQIINGGYHAMTTTGPVDWNYQVPHIGGAPSRWGESFYPSQRYRTFWGTAFMMQAIPPGSPQTNFDWPIGHLFDALTASPVDARYSRERMRQLDDALARSFLGVVHRYPIESWPRKVDGDSDLANAVRFERADVMPDQAQLEVAIASPYLGDVIAQRCHDGAYADCYYLRLRAMHDAQAVEPETLDEILDWACQLWPSYAWAPLATRPGWSCGG